MLIHLNHNNSNTPEPSTSKSPIKWEIINLQKSKGGLGICETHCQNKALFTKLIWRIMNQPEQLWAKTLKALYYPHCCFLKTKSNQNSSKIWKNIIKIKNETIHMWCWDLSNPSTINIWEDPWIPHIYFKKPFGPRPKNANQNVVADLIFKTTNTWNLEALSSLFSKPLVEEILKIKIPIDAPNNRIIWTNEKNGSFTVKFAYNYFPTETKTLLKIDFKY